MGLGPLAAVYQARFNRYLQNRGIKDTSEQRVWAFLGDGEMDEPESIAGISLAARDGLDNLTFVINCNLQRLDGPVRGNGKIIQELEGLFRGAGWNVIKVVWGREWDELLARDVDGVLVEKMNETLDGEFQKYSVSSGDYVREHFFGPDPRLRRIVEHLSDDDMLKLRRGGHDYRKVYAAYKAATEYVGRADGDPRQDGQGLDARRRASRRATSPTRRRSSARPSSRSSATASSCRSPTTSSRTRRTSTRAPTRRRCSTCSSGARRSAGRCRAASCARSRCPSPSRGVDAEFAPGSTTAVSTTMVFARLLRNLIRDPEHRQAHRADHPRRGAHVRHGPPVQGGRHLRRQRPALRAGRLRARALVPRGDRTARCSRRGSTRRARWPRSSPPGRRTRRTASR